MWLEWFCSAILLWNVLCIPSILDLLRTFEPYGCYILDLLVAFSSCFAVVSWEAMKCLHPAGIVWDLCMNWWLLFFFRRVKLLYLEGCSLLTTEGLESVIHSWKDLQSLRVVSCKNIKDNEISPALATLFTTLKELRWSPDTKSLLPSGVMGKKGDKFFKRAR